LKKLLLLKLSVAGRAETEILVNNYTLNENHRLVQKAGFWTVSDESKEKRGSLTHGRKTKRGNARGEVGFLLQAMFSAEPPIIFFAGVTIK
jgi:hypothetical protein